MADKSTIVATYTAAADHFDALPFWHHFGRLTVAKLELQEGDRVLDLCCGSGASALAAAERVGPTGSVLGVDLTPALIAHARSAAAARGLGQARFEVSDADGLTFGPASFDAVVSVFGMFFLDDMAGALRRAWSWLAPGGRLAITVWGEVVLAPGEAFFWDAVRREEPAREHISKTDLLSRPGALEQLFIEAGIAAPVVSLERWRMPLASPDAFWPVILGTSNRGVFDALSAGAQTRVKREVLDRLRDEYVRGLDMEARVAIARKGTVVEAEIIRADHGRAV